MIQRLAAVLAHSIITGKYEKDMNMKRVSIGNRRNSQGWERPYQKVGGDKKNNWWRML